MLWELIYWENPTVSEGKNMGAYQRNLEGDGRGEKRRI